MKKLFITLILILFAICTIQAQEKIVTIDNQTPGWLSSKLTYDEQVAVEELTVTGYINKADMAFINSLIKNRNLRILDLYAAKLISPSGKDNIIWGNFLNYGTDKTMQKVRMPQNIEGYENTNSTSQIIKSYIDTLEIAHHTIEFFPLLTYWPHYLKLLEGIKTIKKSSSSVYNNKQEECIVATFPSSIESIEELAFSSYIISFEYPFTLPSHLKKIGDDITWFGGSISSYNVLPISENCFNFPDSLIFYSSIVNLESFDVYSSDTISVGSKCQNLYAQLNAKTAYFYAENPPKRKDKEDYKIDTLYVPQGCIDIYKKEYGTTYIKAYREMKAVSSISITPKQLIIKKGEKTKLIAEVFPSDAFNPKYLWSSSDEDIATVSQDGTVTAIKPGKATIFATSVEEEDIYGSCEITVIQPVTGVTMSQSSLNFSNIGETEQLKAIVEPEDAENKNVTWESSNKSVCSVSSNGTAVALSYGKSVVTATTEDGGYVAVCVVTVSEETPDPEPTVVSVTGVSLNVSEVTMTAVGDSYQLQASISPADATNKNVIWKSSNPEVCNVSSNGTVIALSYGSSTVSVTTEDGNFIATCSISVEEPTPDPSVDPLGETEMLLEGISAKKTYVLYNEYYDVYAVYDEVNSTSDVWTTSKTVDASSLGSSWMFFSKDNQYFLYNIGAQKYLLTPNTNLGMVSCTFSDNSEQCRLNIVELGNGRFAFSTNESEKGYMCAYMSSAGRVVNWTSSDNGSAWQFKENPNVAADTSVLDKTVTGIGESILIRSFGSSIYTIDGVKLNITDPSQLEKGVYIVDGKKVIVK